MVRGPTPEYAVEMLPVATNTAEVALHAEENPPASVAAEAKGCWL